MPEHRRLLITISKTSYNFATIISGRKLFRKMHYQLLKTKKYRETFRINHQSSNPSAFLPKIEKRFLFRNALPAKQSDTSMSSDNACTSGRGCSEAAAARLTIREKPNGNLFPWTFPSVIIKFDRNNCQNTWPTAGKNLANTYQI